MLISIVSLLLCLSPAAAEAGTLAIGPMVTALTSQVDHAKLGAAVTSEFSLFKLPLHLSFDLAMVTLGPVNPGAGGDPSAPDLEESMSGGRPFYGTLYLKLPTPVLGFSAGVGVQSFFTDFLNWSAAVPIAASLFLDRTLWDGTFSGSAGITAGLQVTDFKPLAFLAEPRFHIGYRMSEKFTLEWNARMAVVYAASSPSVMVLYPRTTLQLGFGI